MSAPCWAGRPTTICVSPPVNSSTVRSRAQRGSRGCSEDGIRNSDIEQPTLVDNEYIEIEGTDPVQHRTGFLGWLEQVLPTFSSRCLRPIRAWRSAPSSTATVTRRFTTSETRCRSDPAKLAGTSRTRAFAAFSMIAPARLVRPDLLQNDPREMGQWRSRADAGDRRADPTSSVATGAACGPPISSDRPLPLDLRPALTARVCSC